MAFQIHKPPTSSSVPCISTALFVTCLLLCSSLTKPCTGQDPDLVNLTPFDQLPGYLFVDSASPCIVGGAGMSSLWGGLRWCYKENGHSDSDLEQKGMFSPHYFVDSGMSFSMAFTMSIYEPDNQIEENCRLVFIIKSACHVGNNSYESLLHMLRTNNACPIPSNPTPHNVAGSNVSAQISTHDRTDIWVQIGIKQPSNSSMANKYSMWIDYYHIQHRMLIYADAGEGTSKPANAIADEILNRPWMMKQSASFGFFSSMGQLLQLHTWKLLTTVKRQPSCPRAFGRQWAIAWSSVLGPAAAAAITATVVYLNSKYRRWKTEQNKLIRTMRSLPGVPTLVDYAE